jgi:L-cysteine:1D-myo-inositol 2-amino-2-deoxy-alpha-D-glucopyranoside ligase
VQSWTTPELSPLPASTTPLRLFDSRVGRVVPVTPLEPGRARLYVCGITPYDSTHLGHAATYHAADLMRRALVDSGLEVTTAQNITDVDDPLLERADRDGVDWRELAASQVELFSQDMAALRIIAPETYRSVSEAMDEIIATVTALHERGRAYQVPTPDAEGDDWYLDLARDGALGDVSGWSEEQMLEVFAERGGDPDREGKRGRFDPLLWRAERKGEPAWDAGALGRGRPGWHVECVSIAEEGLDLPFDIQAGGSDLVFPHHDLSAAHSIALGRPFAVSYAHAGMVALDGEKMSKSLGNLVFVHRLVREGVDPMAIRLVRLGMVRDGARASPGAAGGLPLRGPPTRPPPGRRRGAAGRAARGPRHPDRARGPRRLGRGGRAPGRPRRRDDRAGASGGRAGRRGRGGRRPVRHRAAPLSRRPDAGA